MDLDIEKLAQEEVQRLVKEKINKKLHLHVQNEMKKYEYSDMISYYVNNGLQDILKNTNLSELINVDKLQKDITNIVAKEMLSRLTTSYRYEDEEVDHWDSLDKPW